MLAELNFKKTIEIEQKIQSEKFQKKPETLWLFLGISLLKQFKLNECETSFNVAKNFGCDKGLLQEQLDILFNIKSKMRENSLVEDENSETWQRFKIAYSMGVIVKERFNNISQMVKKSLEEGNSKKYTVELLISKKIFIDKRSVVRFVDKVIKDIKKGLL